MALIHNDVFDAALTEVKTAIEAEVQDASGSALVDAVTLDASNYGATGDYASGGRKCQCLVSDTSDMASIAVDTGGSATKVALKDASAAVLIEADITSAPVSLGSSDAVTLGTFSVILKDPS